MKVIKVVFNDATSYILNIVNEFENRVIIETFNTDIRREQKQARSIQTNFGTKKVPLLVFEDENLEEVDAIWSESDPDWGKRIKEILTKLEEM